jgi:hypothetical protein
MRYKNAGRAVILLCILLLRFGLNAQTFTYSGYIRNADGSGAVNVPVKLYRRTTPVMTGFTSQNNFNGHSYYRSTGSMTWTAARTACTNMGGHLVTSTSLAENNFLFSLWPSGWIGLTDEVTEGQWKWVTGETYSWSYWNGGEPNNAGNEDYVQFVGGGRWNDLPNASLPYVLEFEYIVTYTAWTVYQTVYTNSAGYYSFSQPTNPSVEWYIELSAPTPTTAIQISDVRGVVDVVLGITTLKSMHYHQYDVNNDNKLTVSDAIFINNRRMGITNSWNGLSGSRLYTTAQFNTLNASTTNLKASVVGVTSITINSPVSGTTNANYYLIAPGYKNQVSY